MNKAKTKELLEAVRKASLATYSKSAIPVLSHVLLEQDGDMLRVSGTDIETCVLSAIVLESEKTIGNPLCIPAKKLVSILKTMPEEVSISFEEDRATLNKFTLVGMNAEEFPKLPEEPPSGQYPISWREARLSRAMESVLPHASNDVVRPHLNGVHFEVGASQGFNLVATDGHTLAKFESISSPGVQSTCTIPTSTIQILKKLLNKKEGTTLFHQSGKNAFFVLDDGTRIITKLVEGFPNYRQVIPKEAEKVLQFRIEDLLKALSRTLVVNKEEIMVSSVDEGLKLYAKDYDSECSEEVEASSWEEFESFGINPTYFIKALKSLGDIETCRIELGKDSKTAIMFKPAHKDEEGETTCLVMPQALSRSIYANAPTPNASTATESA